MDLGAIDPKEPGVVRASALLDGLTLGERNFSAVLGQGLLRCHGLDVAMDVVLAALAGTSIGEAADLAGSVGLGRVLQSIRDHGAVLVEPFRSEVDAWCEQAQLAIEARNRLIHRSMVATFDGSALFQVSKQYRPVRRTLDNILDDMDLISTVAGAGLTLVHEGPVNFPGTGPPPEAPRRA